MASGPKLLLLAIENFFEDLQRAVMKLEPKGDENLFETISSSALFMFARIFCKGKINGTCFFIDAGGPFE